jgi:glycosyltransferase involved in cell wall biosynthesis
MMISIIVPAFNEEKLLGRTLACIREATAALPQQTWELIVCDNNSTDRTAEIARSAGARVVFEPLNQIARARNAGAAQAKGDWLLFIDADSSLSMALLRETAIAIQSGKVLAGGATVTMGDIAPRYRLWVAWWNAVSRLCRWAAGSFIFCEATAFRELRGFDESFYAGEEIDFSVRAKRLARRRGRKVVILHRHPLLTSDRKVHLYGMQDMLGFMLKAILTGGRALRRKDDCYVWYDGRR